jgi:hypothetical protein
MRHALALRLSLLAGAATVASMSVAAAPPGRAGSDSGLIRPKHQVSDDPLDGLPAEGGQRAGGKGSTSASEGSTCKVSAAPADARDIGDLRATLALVTLGPRTWAFPMRTATRSQVRLRVSIDGEGKLTELSTVAGNPNVGSAIAKKLTGKRVPQRREAATVGVVVLAISCAR